MTHPRDVKGRAVEVLGDYAGDQVFIEVASQDRRGRLDRVSPPRGNGLRDGAGREGAEEDHRRTQRGRLMKRAAIDNELIKKLEEELKTMEAWAQSLRKLAVFGQACFEEHREFVGGLDGAWLQEKAIECGLLEAFVVGVPCEANHCACERGDTCYRATEDARVSLGEAS